MFPESYPIFSIDSYGSVSGEEDMMNEIYQRGPIACGIDASGLENYTGGIINDTSGTTNLTHVVSIVGYGVEDGIPYWFVRNSWGSYFGESGFFRIIRGTNNLGIEKSCHWAAPKDTWTDKVKNITNSTNSNSVSNQPDQPFLAEIPKGCIHDSFP